MYQLHNSAAMLTIMLDEYVFSFTREAFNDKFHLSMNEW